MKDTESSKSFTERGMPTSQQLVVPILVAVAGLGGSARVQEIVDEVLELLPNSEALLAMKYQEDASPPVLIHRIAWGRSTAKRIGALEQPDQGVYLLTETGENILKLPEDERFSMVHDLDREASRVLREQKKLKRENAASQEAEDLSDGEILTESSAEAQERDWKSQLLERLHQLPPEGFEKFVIYLLRRQGLQLQHTGSSGDEGVDAIGTAPLSPVLSSRVAMQIKRYAPEGKPIGRETVALFQRDAQTKGAERAIIVTLSRFTEPARKAATSTVPTVDLISGDRLAELIRADGESGVKLRPTVDPRWFDKFD
ncbi:restriction endonuclease [Corynebacterium sp. c24Ua_83]|uniref:restriction endonuclease n=1 Tax=Corynebacterium sp. c24Ua_83 TaxID=3032350 RepID=UPI003264F3ED